MSEVNLIQEPAPYLNEDRATFVWYGGSSPGLIGDFNHWDEEQLISLEERRPGVWKRTIEFPPDAYIEYAYLLDGERVFDPLNANVTYNGVNAYNNYFYMPRGKPTPLAQYRMGVPRGKVLRKHLDTGDGVAGGARAVDFYRPPVSEPTPLIVVFDGDDYDRRVRLPPMVDNLIAEGRIRPVSLAMVHNAGSDRMVEYACNDATLYAVAHILLPLAAETLDLVDVHQNRGAYGVLGASMGGLIAMYAGIRLPHLFGQVVSQSGAFFRDSVLFDLIRSRNVQTLEIWMDVGQYEFLTAPNREMHALLVENGYAVTYREYPAGHNYPAWRDDVWRGLEALFPPEDPPAAGAA